jgi:acetyl esterase/lipase
MHKTIQLLLACLFATTASCDAIWNRPLSIESNIPYGDHPAQVADIYVVGELQDEAPWFKNKLSANPTLVWYHGGAWLAGDKSSTVYNVVDYLEAGWNVVNVNYRLGAGTAPMAVDDAMCAYKWAVDQAMQAGNSKQFVVGGLSAGGHLALVVGMLNNGGDHECIAEIAPSAVVNWFGITDIEKLDEYLEGYMPSQNYALLWAGSKNRVTEISKKFSPLVLISDASPPVITIHGTDDTVVPYDQALLLHTTLKTPNKLITIDRGGHGDFTENDRQGAIEAIFSFLSDSL